MRPTVHDIAETAGVSLATVDRVLNRRPGVKAATRERVEAAIKKIGFVRDMAAANLAKGRIYPLAFVIPRGNNSFMEGLMHEVEQAIARSAQER
ncbi:MAG: LacI family transcriptional regulator, partial [Alphaproteobacteria bacterium]